ncbi:MAG: hydroxyacylglutathione hydrolase, partial [Alphaproteobacteria bacterium]|nr:hydroxyacylglutathione hydrolase [Alphaproteobacteria bacterium]
VDPDNEALQAACRRIDELRSRGERTIPSELGEEKLANPFLRADLPDMQRLVGMEGAAPEAVFAEIRRRKDNF